MFNLQGSEIIFILLIALVVLGPEKLPGAIRRVTSLYAELRRMSSGFQEEFKSVLDEPLREMKSTADLMKSAADPKRIAEEAEREAELEAAAAKKAKQARDTTWAMEATGAAHLAEVASTSTAEIEPETDAFADPVDETSDDTADDGTDDGAVDEPDEDVGRVEDVDHVEDFGAVDDVDTEEIDETDLDFEPEEKSA